MVDGGTAVVRVAPAKLNLTLAVLGRRGDGYHDLHSVMVPLGLADRLSVAPAIGGSDSLRVVGPEPGPARENLVLRAIEAARTAVGRRVDPVPLAIRLEKRIPIAAGLAGGSSDALAALDAALEAWALPRADRPELARRLATEIGSDVPFFLAAGPALVEGRGERVTPLPGIRPPMPGILLVCPAVRVPTPEVFAVFDAGVAPPDRGSTRLTSEHLASELRAGLGGDALAARAGVLGVANDLASAAAVVAPGLIDLRRAVTRTLRRPVGLSGSGPTLWVLYPSPDAALVAATTLMAVVADGGLPSLGGAPPEVIATVIAANGPDGAPDGRPGAGGTR